MANIWEEAILILAGNLNSGLSYLITTVHTSSFFTCCDGPKRLKVLKNPQDYKSMAWFYYVKCITSLMTNNASVWPHLEATFYCWGCVRNWSKKGGAVIEQNWKAFQPRRVHKCGMPDLDDRLMFQIWLSKSFFYAKNLSEFFFIEEYQFRRSFFLLLSFFENFNFWTN